MIETNNVQIEQSLGAIEQGFSSTKQDNGTIEISIVQIKQGNVKTEQAFGSIEQSNGKTK